MDWNDFAKRLTLELSRLPVTSFLIVQGPSGQPYVQAMRSEGVLDAEAVSSEFLPRPLAPRQERRLRSLGWEPPEDDRKNWWDRYTWRDRGGRGSSEHLEACAMLAWQMVDAFRDVYGIESPLELVYQAARTGPGGGPLALPGLGIPPAVPDDGGRAARSPERSARPSGTTLENALTDARERGDQQGYLELLARAVLYLPAPGDLGGAEQQFATAQFGDGTFVLAFTSPEAMDRSLQGQAVHHRESTLAELSRHWPHPEWQLAVNPGLPSAAYLDAGALLEPAEPPTPTPPVPTDVHVAGRSARARTRGAPPPRGGSDRAGATGAPQRPEGRRPRPPMPATPEAAQAPAAARSGPAVPPRPAAAPPRPPEPAPRPGEHAPPPAQAAPPPTPSPTPPPTPSPAPSPAPPQHPGAPPQGPAARRPAARSQEPAAPAPSLPAPVQRPAPPAERSGPPEQRPDSGRWRPEPSAARETPADPHGLPVAPLYGTREKAAPGGPPHDRDTARRPPEDVPVAGPGQRAESRAGHGEEHGAPVQGTPAEGASQIVVMQKVVRPEHVQHYVEGGYDLVAGYVHRLQDVRELTTPAAIIRALGLVYEGSPFTHADEQVFVIRWPAVKPALYRRPLGGIDEWSMGIIPGGWVIEKAPFPGSGYAPGDGPAIAEFKIESQRLPHGAELYRIDAHGTQTLVARYDADLRRWLVKLPGGRA